MVSKASKYVVEIAFSKCVKDVEAPNPYNIIIAYPNS
jgi:hypothetical protein